MPDLPHVGKAGTMKRITGPSPRARARLAGAFYVLSVLTAIFSESLGHGRVAVAAGLVAVALYVAVTLFMYAVFKPMNRSLALLAACSNLVCLTFEALRWNPRGVDIALVFHGIYCLLIGYIAFGSTFLPRILGPLMAFGGLAWLTFGSPPLAQRLSPYNIAAGFLGVGSLMLWLLVIGVNGERWKEQAGAAGTASIAVT